MITVLQILGISVAAVGALVYLLLVVVPPIGAMIHARRFNINPWHGLGAALFIAALVLQLGWYGYVDLV